MPGTITTTGMTGGTIATTHNSGESVSQWVDRHTTAVDSGTPGNKLTTTWPCSGMKTVVTNRGPGESNEDFVDRHETAYTEAMVDCPPVP